MLHGFINSIVMNTKLFWNEVQIVLVTDGSWNFLDNSSQCQIYIHDQISDHMCETDCEITGYRIMMGLPFNAKFANREFLVFLEKS